MKNSRVKIVATFLLTIVFTAFNILLNFAGIGFGNKSYAINTSQTVTFPESTSQYRSTTITIPNLVRVTSASVNTGNVSYSVSGNNVTITVNNGSYSNSYTSSQYVSSVTSNTGATYPPSSIYHSSGSYSGSLSRYNVVNNKYYTTSQESRTFSSTLDNEERNYYDKNGVYLYTDYSLGSNDNSSVRINEDGYVGNIPKTSFALINGPTRYNNADGSYKMVTLWRGYYSGTLTKDVITWHDNYTGYYSGYIYGSTSYYYSYNVTLSYVTNVSPSITIISPTQNQIFSETANAFIPTVSVSDPDGDTLTCRFFVNSEASPRDTKTISNTATAQNVSFNAINLGALSEGNHTLKFTVYDGEVTTQSTVNIRIDKTAPALGTVSVTSTDSSITLSGSATDSVSMHETPYSYVVNGTESPWTTNTQHTFSSLIPNTGYAAKFRARDKAGHITEVNQIILTKAQTPEFTVSAVEESSIALSATDLNPAMTQYLIQSGTQYVGADGQLTTEPTWLTLTNRKATITGLNANTSYNFTIKARNSEGTETSTFSVIGKTLASPPQSLQFKDVAQDTITVFWSAIDGALWYDVEVDGVVVNNGTAASYIHNGLQSETHHTYRIRVVNSGGTGHWSSTFNMVTLPDRPGVPTNIQASATKTEIMIAWDAVADATGYDIEADGVVQDNGAALSFTHYGLEPDTTYSYRVRAKNAGGNGDWSSKMDMTTLPNPPQPPSEITSNITKNTIQVIWDQLPKTDRYEIEVDGFIYNNGTETTYLHEGLSPLTAHQYRIRGINAGGTGAWSDYFTINTHPYEPWMPENVMASSDTNSITLTWYMAAYAWCYEVEIDGNEIIEVNGTVFENSGLESGTAHTYRVRSKNITGTSEWTSPLTLSTSPSAGDVAMAITNVAAIVTNNTITLSWDASATLCEYEIETDGILKNNGFNTAFNHTGLEPGTYHDYKIRVKKEGQSNEWQMVLTLSTLPTPPGAPEITNVYSTNNSIQIWWESIDGAVSYDIEIDGEAAANITDITYLHQNLLPGMVHQYRVRARTMTDISPWSALVEVYTSTSKYEVNCSDGEYFSFTALGLNVQDFTGVKYVVTYDSDMLEIADLCEFTPYPDVMMTGSIPGTNLTVKQVPGRIEFVVTESIIPGSVWSGEITTVKFKAKNDGTTYIEFNEER